MEKITSRSSLLYFFTAAVVVLILQIIILSPHLQYGFADVDWDFLLIFKELSATFHNPIEHFLNAWSTSGVYTYQIYYIGFIEKIFGMNYINFQLVTHFFKFIATISVYPLVFLITKDKLVSALTTILYGVAYSAVGVMYTVVTSGLFVAIPVMNIFFIYYCYLLNQKKNSVISIVIAVFLFFLTLLLATERMYPLLPVLILIELFQWFKKDFSKKELFKIIKRLSFFAVIFFIIFLSKPPNLGSVSGNTAVTINKFEEGNWQVIISPIISFGSLFLPRDYWKYLGTATIQSFTTYLSFFITGPLIFFSAITIFLSYFVSKKRKSFTLITIILTSVFAILIYILSAHQINIPKEVQIHFDETTLIPALIGDFVICLTISLFKYWWETGRKDNLIMSMIGGIVISLIFIISTWMAADWILVFVGVHRYLTIPAIGSSLFIGGWMAIIFRKLYLKSKTRGLAYLFLLLLIPLILFNYDVINKYFQYELYYAGTDAAGHIRMKNKLWSYLPNFSNTEPSIFYFDESQDHDNGYFDETTIMAGFNFWMRFRGDKIVDSKLTPALLRSNLICHEERSMCLSTVKALVTEQNGVKGILYGKTFYKPENFYAFRFINKDIINIKPEVIKAIGLE